MQSICVSLDDFSYSTRLSIAVPKIQIANTKEFNAHLLFLCGNANDRYWHST